MTFAVKPAENFRHDGWPLRRNVGTKKKTERERVFRARSIKRATLPNPLTLAGNTKALAETLQDKC